MASSPGASEVLTPRIASPDVGPLQHPFRSCVHYFVRPIGRHNMDCCRNKDIYKRPYTHSHRLADINLNILDNPPLEIGTHNLDKLGSPQFLDCSVEVFG